MDVGNSKLDRNNDQKRKVFKLSEILENSGNLHHPKSWR